MGEMVLCSVCDIGMISRTLRMRSHDIAPGVPCEGSNQWGRLEEEDAIHRLVGVNFALLSTPYGVLIRWRWQCECTRRGRWTLTWNHADDAGRRHATRRGSE